MAAFSEYDQFDALGLAELVRKQEVAPEELLEAAIDRTESRNPELNAVINKMYDLARKQIQAGLSEGPFRGVPFLLKDLYAAYKGEPLTCGSRFLADVPSDRDSEMVIRYKRGGLVIFGKTNTPEFGLNVSTEPSLFGPTRNPWNKDYMAGGSSGGSASAVAGGITPVAHASDGAGSIRIPASCCGVFGLKVSRGRNPAGPSQGERTGGLSVEHALTKTVRDSAALLDLTHGPDVGAPYGIPQPVRPFLEEVSCEPRKLRVAVTTRAFSGVPVDGECVKAVEDTVKLLEELGHSVEEAAPAFSAEALGGATAAIMTASIAMALEGVKAAKGVEIQQDDLEPLTHLLLKLGGGATAMDYARSVHLMHATGRIVGQFFETYDVLLTPTLAQIPQPIGTFSMAAGQPEAYIAKVFGFSPFTAFCNAAGNPAMSVPLCQSKDGLPIGVQFATRYADEATLFQLAGQLERARPWVGRYPK